MAVEFNKIMDASKMMLVAVLVFNLLIIAIRVGLGILGFGAGKLGGAEVGFVAMIIAALFAWGLLIIDLLGNFAIFLYSGFQAAKKGLDLVSCGLVGLLVYGVSGILLGVLRLVLDFLGLGARIATSSDAASGFVAGVGGGVSLALGAFCAIILFGLGLGLNFVISLVGGLAGGAK